MRQLALPRPVRAWNLTTLREMRVKFGAMLVRQTKAITFWLAEVAVPRWAFAAILAQFGRRGAAPSPR